MYKELYDYHTIENAAEELVFEEIHHLLTSDKLHFCRCSICIGDIACLTLNNIPTIYSSNFLERTNPREHRVSQLESTRELIKQHLMDAIRKVTDSPHH
ncbi:MAG: hypothetical protein Tsb005_05860 [Gammaproteobacteria bacterium]